MLKIVSVVDFIGLRPVARKFSVPVVVYHMEFKVFVFIILSLSYWFCIYAAVSVVLSRKLFPFLFFLCEQGITNNH